MSIIKSVTGLDDLLKQLKKHTLIYSFDRFKLSDNHNRPVSKRIAERFINSSLVEPCKALSSWFEKEWRLKYDLKKAKTFKEAININEDKNQSV